MRLIPLVFVVHTACGGAVAESPLMVQLGLTHENTERALRSHQFCLEKSSSEVAHTQQKQVFPRCQRAAAEHGPPQARRRQQHAVLAGAQQAAPSPARSSLQTPVSGRSSSTRSAASRSPAIIAATERACS